ncbi:hem peroxidase [Dillenia turbinata]|uniref:Peroxidase n=1 Tax=Dillenia turbinata TaxID=194707 RepID=A0AAN8UP86_9MAGN
MLMSIVEDFGNFSLLEYDYYRESCPQAEQIIRAVLQRQYEVRPNVAPALLRLGCDASVLLDPDEGIESEKESPPNETLKGFEVIDLIKSALEEVCPGVVSCADIIVLAARDCVILAGGPFYPLYTGRKDSTLAYKEVATNELPSPHDDLPKTLALFASRGFNERETVSLLGAHSIGMIHCKFFYNRLFNFSGTEAPDPSLDLDFLNIMRMKCNNTNKPSGSLSSTSLSSSFAASPTSNFDALSPTSSPSPEEPGMEMDYEGVKENFGTLYYRSLLQGRGILHVDQQLTVREETADWVRAYSSDASLFRRDFATVMMKLSNLRVLTAPMGQVRLKCSKVAY